MPAALSEGISTSCIEEVRCTNRSRAMAISMRAKDEFGRLLGVGITTWLSAQAIVHEMNARYIEMITYMWGRKRFT